MFSCWQLYDGIWIGGKFVFLKEVRFRTFSEKALSILSQVPQLEGEDRVLRLVFILLTFFLMV